MTRWNGTTECALRFCPEEYRQSRLSTNPLVATRACSHYSQRFDDECKAEKRQENDVQFFKT